MTIIRKKIWPEIFQRVLDGKKKYEVRLADFDIQEGDTLVLEEWNPETKSYTGRSLEKKAKSVVRFNVAKFNSIEDIKKYGHWLIELE